MAMSPEEAQRARIKAALDRVGSLNPADPPEGLRAPRAAPVPAAPGTALAVDNRPNFTMGGNGQPASVRAPSTALAVDNRPNFTMGGQPQQPGVTDARFRTTGGNPNVPTPGGSAEAQQFRAQQAANQGPQPRPQSFAQRATDLGKQAGQRMADFSKGVAASPRGQWLASVAQKVGKVAAPLAAVGSIAPSLEQDSTARYAKRFGMDEPTGDGSVGDIAKFAGLRALGYASDLGNTLTMGLAGNAYADDPGARRPEQAPTSPSPSLRAPQATQSQVRASEPQEPAAPSNVVTVRNGNQFSGENIREGFSYDGAPRAGLTSMPAGNFASVSPTLDRQRAEAMAQLTPAQAAAALGDPGYTRGSTPGMGGFGSGTLSSAANERFNSTPSGSTTGLTEPERDRMQQRELTGLREMGDSSRTASQVAAQRYGVDAQVQSGLRSDATARRGQDMDLLGRETVARTSLRSAERAAEKDAFDRMLKIAEFDTKRADTALAQRQDADKSWQTAVENRFRDPADPTKADTRKVAAFNTAVDATIPSLADQLEKSGQGAVAADLRKRGRAALGPAELDELQQLFELRELALQTDGWALGSSGAVMSNDLSGYRPRAKDGMQKNLIGSDTVVTANGTKIRRDKLVYGPDGNAILPDFGVPRTDFRRYFDQPNTR